MTFWKKAKRLMITKGRGGDREREEELKDRGWKERMHGEEGQGQHGKSSREKILASGARPAQRLEERNCLPLLRN